MFSRRTGELRRKLVIWGAGGHAKVVAEVLRLQGDWEILGFLDDISPERKGERFFGATVLGTAEVLPSLRQSGVVYLALGVGNCCARLQMLSSKAVAGFEVVTGVHPSAIVSKEARIKRGTIITAGAVINPCSRIGCGVIINTGATVDHDCWIADGAHICPGVHLAGNVKVGRAAWVGIGSTVIEKIRIGAGAYIGAGSVVVSAVPAQSRVCGVPAKPMKNHA
jgi:UDP-N-acetylbacillosamine N-acetyltransferase